jgi:hypothetical protein
LGGCDDVLLLFCCNNSIDSMLMGEWRMEIAQVDRVDSIPNDGRTPIESIDMTSMTSNSVQNGPFDFELMKRRSDSIRFIQVNNVVLSSRPEGCQHRAALLTPSNCLENPHMRNITSAEDIVAAPAPDANTVLFQ